MITPIERPFTASQARSHQQVALDPLSDIPEDQLKDEVTNRQNCYNSSWTGLLTSGDGSCHRWTAVGVRVTPLGRYNNNRTI